MASCVAERSKRPGSTRRPRTAAPAYYYVPDEADGVATPNLRDRLTRDLHISGRQPPSRNQRVSTLNTQSASVADAIELALAPPPATLADRERTLATLKRLQAESLASIAARGPAMKCDPKQRELMALFNETHHALFRSRFEGLAPAQQSELATRLSELDARSATFVPDRQAGGNADAVAPFAENLRIALQPGKSVSEHLDQLRVREKQLVVERWAAEWETVRQPRPQWYAMRSKDFVGEARLCRRDATLPGAHQASLSAYAHLYTREKLDAILALGSAA